MPDHCRTRPVHTQALLAPTGAAALPCRRVSTPSHAALALRRRRLLALHRRHAGRVRAIFYWLGADLEVIDDAVLRCFLLAERHGLLPSDARAGPWLGHLAWRVAQSPAHAERSSANPHRDHDHDDLRPLAPALPPAADALARFLAAHAPEPITRAAFVLAEFAGLGLAELAALLPAEPPALRDALRHLRRTFAADPEVQIGGPRSLLAASLAPFLADHAWNRRHLARLAAHTRRHRPGLWDILRRPPGILGLGLAAVALLLLLRPAAPAPAPPRAAPPVVVAVPTPARASMGAKWRPMPLDAPVTSAVLPASEKVCRKSVISRYPMR